MIVELATKISSLIQSKSLDTAESFGGPLLIISVALMAILLKVISSTLYFFLTKRLRKDLLLSYLRPTARLFRVESFDMFLSLNSFFDAYSDSIVRTSLGVWTNVTSIIVLGFVVVKRFYMLDISVFLLILPLLISLVLLIIRKIINKLSGPIVELTVRRNHYLSLIKENQAELIINNGLLKVRNLVIDSHVLMFNRIALIKSIEAIIPDVLKLMMILLLAIVFYQGSANPKFLSILTELLIITSALQPAILGLLAISSKWTYLNSFLLKQNLILK